MTSTETFGISDIHYMLPPLRYSVRELHAAGMLLSEPEAMEELGFEYGLIWDRPTVDVATDLVAGLLKTAGIEPRDVDIFINASAIPANALVPPSQSAPTTPENRHLQQFMNTSAKVQDEIGLVNAQVIGMSEMSCSSLMAAVWTARALMIQGNLDIAVCINVDKFGEDCKREVVYNIVSDSACGVVVRRDASCNRIVAYDTMTRGYFWDSDRRQNEMLASYFTTGSRIVQRTLKKSKYKLDDIRMLVPHNVSKRSWQILSDLIGYPVERVYLGNIGAIGHSIAADNFINLKDIRDRNLIEAGAPMLMYTFGLGAHWGCMVLEA
ncbi:MAG: hypothetical protein JNM13_09190 [Hyphomicrobiaceae bacterium]|nr:hypothetical protein [Hyphomicrobiaceae bacterium]